MRTVLLCLRAVYALSTRRLRLLCLAMLTFALTSAFSSPRHLEWKLEDANPSKRVFLGNMSSESTLDSSAHHLRGAWQGDALSRLVFYSSEIATHGQTVQRSNGSELEIAPMVSWGHPSTIAYDVPWNNLIRQVTPRSVKLPSPCIDESCGTWDRVRSVDLGKCSIELPYGRPMIPSPLLSLMIGDGRFSLAETLLDGVGEALEANGKRGCNKKTICGRVSFTARPDDSSWYIDADENLCLQARTYVFGQIQRGLGFVPVTKKCRNRPALFELCGSIGLSPDKQIEWTTDWYSFELEPGNYNDCSKRMIDDIRSSIGSQLVGTSTKPDILNSITQALREQLGSQLSISHVSILESLPETEPLRKLLFPSCSNPAPFPGNVSRGCANPLLNLPTRCISSDPASLTGTCHIASPLTRIETTPYGVELILSEHAWPAIKTAAPDRADWIWNLRNLSKFVNFELDDPRLNAIYYYQCVSVSDDDRLNQRTNSRMQERLLRGPKRATLGAGR